MAHPIEYFSKYPEFRFIKLGMWDTDRAKVPIERGWKRTKNYPCLNEEVMSHIKEGYNYGVATGYGDLVVVDADVQFLTEIARRELPHTFEVKTGRGCYHQYYKCKLERSLRLIDMNLEKDKQHIGEIQSHGKQVVGPGSMHPNGNRYTIVNPEMQIAEITEAKLREVFSPWLQRTRKRKIPEVKVDLGDFKNLNVGNIVDTQMMRHLYNGDCQGAHPVHGSGGGANFTVNPLKNVWYCFRHDTGGGPLLLIAVIEGIIDCEDAYNGILTGEVLEKAVKVAKEKYGLGV